MAGAAERDQTSLTASMGWNQAGTAAGAPRRDPAAVARFVERFASVLVEAGIPRMPARVFSALLATDSGRLTAAELSEQRVLFMMVRLSAE